MSSKWVNSSNCGGNSLKAKLTSHSVAQILKKKKRGKNHNLSPRRRGKAGKQRRNLSQEHTKGREGKGREGKEEEVVRGSYMDISWTEQMAPLTVYLGSGVKSEEGKATWVMMVGKSTGSSRWVMK